MVIRFELINKSGTAQMAADFVFFFFSSFRLHLHRLYVCVFYLAKSDAKQEKTSRELSNQSQITYSVLSIKLESKTDPERTERGQRMGAKRKMSCQFVANPKSS